MEKGLIVYLLFAVGIIPLVLLASHWRKIVNPVIEIFYEVSIFSRKKKYLPPKISIEGLGIGHNLNIIEALFLAQKPLKIILGMLLEKAIETGAIQIVSAKPLKIEIDRILPDTLDRFEREFARICGEDAKRKRQEKLANFLIRILKTLSNRMRGYSLVETVEFYRTVIDAAVEKAEKENIQTIVKQLVDDMDELTRTVTKATNPFREVPVFKEVPDYLKRRSSYRGSGGLGGRIGGGGGGGCACAGCACACACAGCACACAGGGR